MDPMENYKNLLTGSHFLRLDVSGSQLRLHCSGSISLINSTVISGCHSNGTKFYKWVVCKIKNLLSGSNFVRREVISGSQLLLHCSGCISLMNS